MLGIVLVRGEQGEVGAVEPAQGAGAVITQQLAQPAGQLAQQLVGGGPAQFSYNFV